MKLTVALPVFNGMPYLPAAVESILGQSLSEFRFIIINDGSTDASTRYLDSIDDPRVTVVHQENHGLGATLNRSLALCDTEYYARMDADDVSHPRRLEMQLRFMEEHANTILLGTGVAFICGERRFQGPVKSVEHAQIRRALLTGRAAICHPSVMMRTETAKSVGGYRIRGAGEDIDFFLRISEAGRMANLPNELHLMRIHGSSLNCVAQDDIVRGSAYAIRCARNRMGGLPEPSPDTFRRDWESRGLLQRITSGIDSWSAVQYRRALLDLAHARACRGMLRLACASVCRPRGFLRRLRNLAGASGSR